LCGAFFRLRLFGQPLRGWHQRRRRTRRTSEIATNNGSSREFAFHAKTVATHRNPV
jgi:hypothetical protein